MPGPTTEVLSDDLKGLRDDLKGFRDDLHKVEISLREDIHKVETSLGKVETSLSKVETSLREDTHKVATSLKEDNHQLDKRVLGLSTEFGVAKWVVAATLVTTLSGIGSGIWWAATITAEVKNLSSRFNGLEASIAKLIEQTKPAPRP